MNVMSILDDLQKKALRNESLRGQLLATQEADEPIVEFCRIARENGFELYPMDIITVGEDFYATMRRSTNGGGENSPKLEGEDDFYELFMAGIK